MAKEKSADSAQKETVISYKGFDKNLICRGFQYEIGQTYTHEGEVKACKNGFHACEHPLDVFGYYAPADSRYAIVEQSGELSRHDEDTKIASASITIKAEIALPEMIKGGVDWIMSKIDTTLAQSVIKNAATNTGDYSAATNTGDCSAATVEGVDSVAVATGYQSKAKACAGSAIVLCCRDDDCKLIHIRAAMVGQDGIKPDVFYQLDENGNFVEVEA